MKLNEIGVSYSFEYLFESKESRMRGILNNKQKADKLQAALEADPTSQSTTAEEVMARLGEADPSRNGKYLNWIVDRYSEGDFKVEDLSRVTQTLTAFEQYSRVLDQKDINAYGRLSDLQQALRPHMDSDKPVTSGEQKRRLKQQAMEESDVFYKGNNFLVLIPKTTDAACYLGRGTEWCTAYTQAENRFEYYNNQGPLYTIITKLNGKTRKFQLHYESDQFMDENDNDLSQQDIAALSENPAYTEFLNKLVVKHYA